MTAERTKSFVWFSFLRFCFISVGETKIKLKKRRTESRAKKCIRNRIKFHFVVRFPFHHLSVVAIAKRRRQLTNSIMSHQCFTLDVISAQKKYTTSTMNGKQNKRSMWMNGRPPSTHTHTCMRWQTEREEKAQNNENWRGRSKKSSPWIIMAGRVDVCRLSPENWMEKEENERRQWARIGSSLKRQGYDEIQ